MTSARITSDVPVVALVNQINGVAEDRFDSMSTTRALLCTTWVGDCMEVAALEKFTVAEVVTAPVAGL